MQTGLVHIELAGITPLPENAEGQHQLCNAAADKQVQREVLRHERAGFPGGPDARAAIRRVDRR